MSAAPHGRLRVRRAHSASLDCATAARDLRRELDADGASIVIFFCSPDYHIEELGVTLGRAITAPLVGCTTAGQLGQTGYVSGGITAVSLRSAHLRATLYPIETLSNSEHVSEVGYRAVASMIGRAPFTRTVGLLLLDGLANAEELVTATLHQSLGEVPLVGGSAAAACGAPATFVYDGRSFRSGAGVLALLDTTLPFATLKVQHVAPGPRKVVVTEADAERRLVHELNGKPAATEYARLLGVPASDLDARLCGDHPLVLSVGDEHFVRGVRSVNSDGSLAFSCAVEAGLILSIGTPLDPLGTLVTGFERLRERLPQPEVVIGFDCVTRRLQLERTGVLASVGDYLALQGVVGGCTFGEQFDAFHVNQTFTALALGG
jgi:hypothetical protein